MIKKAILLVILVGLIAVTVDPRGRRAVLLPLYGHFVKALNAIQRADPKYWGMNGNFVGVDSESFHPNLRVVLGTLPSDLDGIFVRDGPNPVLETGPYHWFDGQGMLHAVRILGGKANYSSQYIQTNRLKIEQEVGHQLLPRIGALKGFIGIARALVYKLMVSLNILPMDPTTEGTANTALLFHHGNLLALDEGSQPFVMKIHKNGQLSSVGYSNLGGKWNNSFSAHAKVDPTTGNLIFFGYRLQQQPYCIHGIADSKGNVLQTVDVHIPEPVMMHDFAITAHYSIIMDLPLVFSPQFMASGGNVFTYNSSRVSRFGLLPRNAKSSSEIRWFEASPCMIFHTLNAWEEGDDVVLLASRLSFFSFDEAENPVPILTRYRFSLKTGKVTEQELIQKGLDFPRVNSDLLTKKTSVGFFAVFSQTKPPLISGVAKIDTDTGKLVGEVTYGDKKYGGESVFVPRKNPTQEDDGYLLTFVHDEKESKSAFWVVDALKMEVSAIVEIPERVPYGFHGTFVPETAF